MPTTTEKDRKLVIWRRQEYRRFLWEQHIAKARRQNRYPFEFIDKEEERIMNRVDETFPLFPE